MLPTIVPIVTSRTTHRWALIAARYDASGESGRRAGGLSSAVRIRADAVYSGASREAWVVPRAGQAVSAAWTQPRIRGESK
jgi:hypothetical protein